MNKKIIKKYKNGKNIKWDSSKYPQYLEHPLRNYYWMPILDETELTDYETGQPLEPGDAVLIDARTGKPASPNSDEVLRDYLTLTNQFEGQANLPELTITYNKDTKSTNTQVGQSYEDYYNEKQNAPIATSKQWEEQANQTFNANDLVKQKLEKRAADRKAHNLTPGVGSLALLGVVGGMAAYNPLAFAASLGAAKLGETTLNYPFQKYGYESFGDWWLGPNASKTAKQSVNLGTLLGGGFGYGITKGLTNNLGLNLVSKPTLLADRYATQWAFEDAKRAAEQNFLNNYFAKMPQYIEDVNAMELSTSPLKTVNLRRPGVFYSRTGELNEGSLIGASKGNWQIRALQPGNLLEKRLSPDGTVSWKNFNWYINSPNVSRFDKLHLLRASIFLNHDKPINYADLQKTSQQLIPTFDKKFTNDYSQYGLFQTGYKSDEVNSNPTLLLTHPVIHGDRTHFGDPTVLGHLRSFSTKNEPDVIHFLESQSDRAQHILNKKAPDIETLTSNDVHMAETFPQRNIQEGLLFGYDNGFTTARFPTGDTAAKIEGFDKQISDEGRKQLDKLLGTYNDIKLEYYKEYYPELYKVEVQYRKSLENTRKLQKLSGDLISKFNQNSGISDGVFLQPWEGPYEHLNQIDFLIERYPEYTQELENLRKTLTEFTNSRKETIELDGKRSDLEEEFLDKDPHYQGFEDQYHEDYRSLKEMHSQYPKGQQLIMSRYDAFPKYFRGLFGNKNEVRNVTDVKGNTWYEVDIPSDINTRNLIFSKVGNINKGSFVSNIRRAWRQLRQNPYLSEKARQNILDQAHSIQAEMENSVHRIPVNTPYGLGHLKLEFPWAPSDPEVILPNLKMYLDLSTDANVANVPMQGGFKLTSKPKSGLFGMDKAIPDKSVYDIFDGDPNTSKNSQIKVLQVKNSLDNIEKAIEESVILPKGSQYAELPKEFDFDNINITLDRNKIPHVDKEDFSAHSIDWFSPHNAKISGLVDQKPLEASHPIVQAAKRYVNYLENKLTDPTSGNLLATVEGSYRAVSEGLPHSPHDVEFLLPEEHLQQVKNIFGVSQMRKLPNGFAYEVDSPEFENLPAGHADFQVIKNGPNGKAIGQLAWQIYEKLHPQEAQKLMDSYLYNVSKDVRAQAALPDVEALELPISAKELFDEYTKSGFYKKKWLFDTHVAKKDKQLKRSPVITEMHPEEVPEVIRRGFSGAKTLKDLGYNIDYTNVEANKVFCDYFNLPYRYAEDPKLMEAFVEKNMHAMLTTTRGSNISIPFRSDRKFVQLPIEERRKLMFQTTNANRGYNVSGPGGNSTNQVGKLGKDNGMDREVSIIKQLLLDVPNNVSTYKTPADIVKRLKQIKSISQNTEYDFQLVNSFNPKDIYKTRELANKHGLTFWSKFDSYGQNGQYIGWVSPEDVSHQMRYVGDQGSGYEVMNAATLESKGRNHWPMSQEAVTKLTEFLKEAVNSNPEFNTLLRRFQLTSEAQQKMYKIRDYKDKVKTGAIVGSTLLSSGLLAGLIYKSIKDADAINDDGELEVAQSGISWRKRHINEIQNYSLQKLKYEASLWLDMDSSKVTKQTAQKVKSQLIKYFQDDIDDMERQIDMYERKKASKKHNTK